MSASSPALSDGDVLRAFTAAYNDKFKELMRNSDGPSRGAAPRIPPSPPCSVCSATMRPRPAVLEFVEASRIAARAPGNGQSSKSGGGGIWMLVVILLVIAGACILFSNAVCPKKKTKTSYGTPNVLSVEGALRGGAGAAPGGGGNGAVVDVSDPSGAVPSSGKAFVMYHATWCGHCKTMRPLYEKEALASKGGGAPAFLACEHEVLQKSGKSDALGIQGYPTIVFFSSGSKVGELVGGVPPDKLRAFIKQHVGGKP